MQVLVKLQKWAHQVLRLKRLAQHLLSWISLHFLGKRMVISPMIEHQSTVSSSLHFSGVGLHTGTMASVVVHPAPVDHGIVFKSNGVLIPAMYTQVCDTVMYRRSA